MSAIRAAPCSASFFEVPATGPNVLSPTSTVAWNVLKWSGPSSLILYRGMEPTFFVENSCSSLLKSPGPHLTISWMSCSSDEMTKPRATSKPPSMYRAPTTASNVSASIDCLLRPPVMSSPLPSMMCLSRPSLRATSASAFPRTSGERSFVSSPSGRSGKSS